MSILRAINRIHCIENNYISIDVKTADQLGLCPAIIFSVLSENKSLSMQDICKKITFLEEDNIAEGVEVLRLNDLIQEVDGEWEVVE